MSACFPELLSHVNMCCCSSCSCNWTVMLNSTFLAEQAQVIHGALLCYSKCLLLSESGFVLYERVCLCQHVCAYIVYFANSSLSACAALMSPEHRVQHGGLGEGRGRRGKKTGRWMHTCTLAFSPQGFGPWQICIVSVLWSCLQGSSVDPMSCEHVHLHSLVSATVCGILKFCFYLS